MAEFDVVIYVRIQGGPEQVNDRIEKALNRAFPSSRKDVLALSWESREVGPQPDFESLAREGGLAR